MSVNHHIGGYVRMIHQEWVGIIERVEGSDQYPTNMRLKVRPVFLPEGSVAPSVMVMLSEVEPVGLLEVLAWASIDP